jgi:phospholipid N-methyltransferase
MDKEYSNVGSKNLEILNENKNFTDWMYTEIKPHLSGSILEIGSGIGTYSKKIIKDYKKNEIILSDIDSNFISNLKKRYKSRKNIKVIKLDIEKTKRVKYKNINTIIALNVLEHIKEDVVALNNLYNYLAPGGTAIILVPAHKKLYNCIDKAVGHYRRYQKKELINKINKTKFKLKEIKYFNFVSIFGWYVNGTILKKAIINKDATKILNWGIPLFKFFDKNVILNKMGISLIVVLEK